MSIKNLAYKTLQSTSHKGSFNNQDSQEIEITQNGFITFRDDIADYIAKNGLTRTQTQLLFFLASLDKYGDRPVKLKVAEILMATSIKKSAYHAAISFFEEKGWFKFIHNEVIVQNLSCKQSRNSDKQSRNSDKQSRNSDKQSRNSDKQSRNSDNQNPKASQGKDCASPQTHSDLYRSSDQIDDDFLNFDEEVNNTKNLDFKNIDSSEQNQIDKFEDSQELIQKDELIQRYEVIKADKAIDDAKTSETVKGTIEGDLFRRRAAIKKFVLTEKAKTSPVKNSGAYFSTFKDEDWHTWGERMDEAIAPSPQTSNKNSKPVRDPVAEDPYRLAQAIQSAMRSKDVDAAMDRIDLLRSINPEMADTLIKQYGLDAM